MNSVKSRTSAIVIGVFVFSFLYYAVSAFVEKRNSLNHLYEHDVENINRMQDNIQNRLYDLIEIRSEEILLNPAIIEAFYKRDRVTLSSALNKDFDVFSREFKKLWVSIHFVDPDGNSFLRKHLEDKHGDNIGGVRPLLMDAIKYRKKVRGIEVGRHKASQRVIQPVFYKGSFIGVLDVGIGLEFFARRLSVISEIKTALVVRKGDVTNENNYGGEEFDKNFQIFNNSNDLFEKILKGRRIVDLNDEEKVNGRSYRVFKDFYVRDFLGRKVGQFLFVRDITEINDWYRNFFIRTAIMSALFIFMMIFVLRKGFVDIVGELEENYMVLLDELKDSEERYKSYINHAPLGIFIADEHGRYVDVNPVACELTGYDKSELLSMRIPDLWADESLENGNIAVKNLLENGSISTAIKFKRKDFSEFYMNVSAVKLSNGLLIGFTQDITKSVEMENELKNLNRELSKKVKEEIDKRRKHEQLLQEQKKFADMGQMVSAIAHQWRQPLNALGLHIQDIYDSYEFGELDEEHMKKFEESGMKLIRHMSSTVDDFRDFFIPDKEKKRFSVVDSISDMLQLIKVQLSSRDIEVNVACDCNTGEDCDCSVGGGCAIPQMCVDALPGEFKQALMNLIYNAVDSIQENKIRNNIEKGRLDINVKRSGELIIIKIRDNGIGIPEDVMPRIFEPYFTTKEEGKGTGIGLYMSKIVFEKQMKGSIRAVNLDVGCEFEIVLQAAV